MKGFISLYSSKRVVVSELIYLLCIYLFFLSTLLCDFYNPGVEASTEPFKGSWNLNLFLNIRINGITLCSSMIFSMVNIFNNFILRHRFGEWSQLALEFMTD